MDVSQYEEFMRDNAGLLTAVAAAVASAGLYYLTRPSYERVQSPVDVNNQSIEVSPGVRGTALRPDGSLVESYHEDARTTYETFTRGMRVSNNGPCLGTCTGPNLTYEWQSYKQVHNEAQQFGSALLTKGLQPTDSTFVGIYAANRPEWVIADLGSAMFSMAYVPLYDTLGVQACTYIINQTSMSVVVCDHARKAESLLKSAGDTPSLKLIILIGSIPAELQQKAEQSKIEIICFDDMLPPKPEQLATICYTSGTTGAPKGVMLTHKNLVSDAAAVLFLLVSTQTVTPDDVHISYLPLAHVFERLIQLMMVQHGARIGFSRGDVKLLMEDLAALKPTIFPTVPRLLNRIYDQVQLGARKSRLKSYIFDLALSRKTALLRQGIITNESIWDKLVFNKVQKLLGGRVRFCIVGSAPLAAKVLDFTRCAFGCLVFEGYGQTEASAAITLTIPSEGSPGHVGPPLPCCHVKLVDVPEMDYYAKDGKGEVCARGHNLMSGYYKNEEKTKETIDEDGWLHTGDVGMWMPSGTLKIIDRRKHIFKLAQGEYLAPEKIEGVYARSSLVAQVFVDGDSLQTFAVGVIVPDPDVTKAWAAKNGCQGSFTDLCKNQALKKAILAELTAEGKKAGLKGFEQVKDIYVCSEPFSVENDLLTPTFKSKRPSLRKYFAAEISDMYKHAKHG